MMDKDFQRMFMLDKWVSSGRELTEQGKKFYNANLDAMRVAVGAMYVHWAEYTKKL